MDKLLRFEVSIELAKDGMKTREDVSSALRRIADTIEVNPNCLKEKVCDAKGFNTVSWEFHAISERERNYNNQLLIPELRHRIEQKNKNIDKMKIELDEAATAADLAEAAYFEALFARDGSETRSFAEQEALEEAYSISRRLLEELHTKHLTLRKKYFDEVGEASQMVREWKNLRYISRTP